MNVKIIENKELFILIRGIKGGILLGTFLIFIYLAIRLMAVNTLFIQEITLNEFIAYFILLVLFFAIMGGIAGKRFSNGRSTKLIWYIVFIILSLPGFFDIRIDLRNGFVVFFMIGTLIVIYAETADLILKWWIKRGIGYEQ